MKFVVERVAFFLAVGISSAAAASTPYLLPISKAVDASGKPLYVDDARIKARIPEVPVGGERLRACFNGEAEPPELWLTFGPTVTAPHTARVTYLACTFQSADALHDRRGTLTCKQARVATAGFDEDPARFFRVEEDVDPALARDVFRDLLA